MANFQKKINVQYDSVLKASKALAELRAKLEKGEITQKEFDKATIKVEKDLNKAAKSIKQVGTALETTTKKTKGMVNGFADLKAGFDTVMMGFRKLKNAMGGVVDAYVQFEKKSKEVQTLGVDDKTIKSIESGLKKVAQDTGKTYEDLWKSTYDTISSGAVTAADSVMLVEKASKFATGAVTDTSSSVTLATKAINAFGLEAKDTDQIFNVFQETIRNGVTTGNELAAALPEVFAMSKSVGLNIKDVGIAITGLTKGGFKTDLARTGLKAIENAVMAYSAKMKKAGIEGVDFAKGQITNFQDMIMSLNKIEMPKLKKMVRSSEAVASIKALGTQLQGAWVESFNDENLSGSFEKAFNKMNETAAEKMASLKAQFDTAMIEVGESLMPLVEQVMKALTDLMPTIKQFGQIAASVMNEVGRFFSKGGWLFAAILLFKKLGIGFGTFKDIFLKGMTAIKTAALSNPLGLILTAASALIPLIMSLTKSNAELAQSASDAAKSSLKQRDSMNEEIKQLKVQKENIDGVIGKLKEYKNEVSTQSKLEFFGDTESLKANTQEALNFMRQSAGELGGSSKLAIENLYRAATDGTMKVEDALTKAMEVYKKAKGIIDETIGKDAEMESKFTVASGAASVDAIGNSLMALKKLEIELDTAMREGNANRIAEINSEGAKLKQTLTENQGNLNNLLGEGGENAKKIMDYLNSSLEKSHENAQKFDAFAMSNMGIITSENQKVIEAYEYTNDILEGIVDNGKVIVDQKDEELSKDQEIYDLYGNEADIKELILGKDLEDLEISDSITEAQYNQIKAQKDLLTVKLKTLETDIKNSQVMADMLQNTFMASAAQKMVGDQKSNLDDVKKEIESIDKILSKKVVRTSAGGGPGGAGGTATTKTDKESKKKDEEEEKKREKEAEEKKKREEELAKKIEKFHDDMIKQQEEAKELAQKQLDEQIKARDAYREAFKGIKAGGFETLNDYRDELELEYAKQYDKIQKDTNLSAVEQQKRFDALAKEYEYFMWKSDYQFKTDAWELLVGKLKETNNELKNINKQYKETLHPIDASIEKFREASALSKKIALQSNWIIGKEIFFFQDLLNNQNEVYTAMDRNLSNLYSIKPDDYGMGIGEEVLKGGITEGLREGRIDISDIVKYLRLLNEHSERIESASEAAVNENIQLRADMFGATSTRRTTVTHNPFKMVRPDTIAEFISNITLSGQGSQSEFQDKLLKAFGISPDNFNLGATTVKRKTTPIKEEDIVSKGEYFEVKFDPTQYNLIEQIIAKITGFDPHDLQAALSSKDFEKQMNLMWDTIENFLIENVDLLEGKDWEDFTAAVGQFMSQFARAGIVLAEDVKKDITNSERTNLKDQKDAFQKLKQHVMGIDFAGIQDELTKFVNLNVEELQSTYDNIIEAQQKGIDPNQLKEMKLSSAVFADRTLGIIQSVANMSLDVQMAGHALADAQTQLEAAFQNNAVMMHGWSRVGNKLIRLSDRKEFLDAKFNELTGAAYTSTGDFIADQVVNVAETNRRIERSKLDEVIDELEKKYNEANLSFEKLQELNDKIVKMVQLQTILVVNDVNQLVKEYKNTFKNSILPDLETDPVFQKMKDQVTKLEVTRKAHQEALSKINETLKYEEILNKKIKDENNKRLQYFQEQNELKIKIRELEDSLTEEEKKAYQDKINFLDAKMAQSDKQIEDYKNQIQEGFLTPEEIAELEKGAKAEKDAIDTINTAIGSIKINAENLGPLKELNEYLAKFGLSLEGISDQADTFIDISRRSTAIQKAQNIVEQEKLDLQKKISQSGNELKDIQDKITSETDPGKLEELNNQYKVESNNLDELTNSLEEADKATKALNTSANLLAIKSLNKFLSFADNLQSGVRAIIDVVSEGGEGGLQDVGEALNQLGSLLNTILSSVGGAYGAAIGTILETALGFIGTVITALGESDAEDQKEQLIKSQHFYENNLKKLDAINKTLKDNFEDEAAFNKEAHNTAQEQFDEAKVVWDETMPTYYTAVDREEAVAARNKYITGNAYTGFTNTKTGEKFPTMEEALASLGYTYQSGVQAKESSFEGMSFEEIQAMKDYWAEQKNIAEEKGWENWAKFYESNMAAADKYIDALLELQQMQKDVNEEQMADIQLTGDMEVNRAKIAGKSEEEIKKIQAENIQNQIDELNSRLTEVDETGQLLYTEEERKKIQAEMLALQVQQMELKEKSLELDKESNDELKKLLRSQGYLVGLQQKGANVVNPLANVNRQLAGYQLPSYDEGSDYIAFDQIAKIHAGEAILTAKENAQRINGAVSTYQTNNIVNNNQSAKVVFNGVTDSGMSKLDNLLKTYGINGVKELATIAKNNR
jgi:TP901 family phage tail tape measure protein